MARYHSKGVRKHIRGLKAQINREVLNEAHQKELHAWVENWYSGSSKGGSRRAGESILYALAEKIKEVKARPQPAPPPKPARAPKPKPLPGSEVRQARRELAAKHN